MSHPVRTIDYHLAKIRIVGSWCCWRLPNLTTPEGYVQIMMNYKLHGAHRIIYEELIGPIPRGLTLDHLCRNPWCCNPNHVEPVTHQVNTLRGAGPTALNAQKTKCLRGHLFDENNTYHIPSGGRACRRCCRDKMRRRRRNYQKEKL